MASISDPRPIARALFALPLTLSLVGMGSLARADDAGAPAASVATPSPTTIVVSGCALRGTYPVAKGTELFDARTGGRLIGSFTGAFSSLTLDEIPTDPTAGRARVRTSNGNPTLRLEGYVAPTTPKLFTARDIAVSSAHVWISSGREVKLVRADADTLTVEMTIAGSERQTVRATAPCEAFMLERPTAAAFEVPGTARGYAMKSRTIDLYDAPKGDVVLQIRMSEGAGQLFWSTESKLGFVHIMSRSDLTVDAWARLSELAPLRKGEMMDQLIPSQTAVSGASLGFDKEPPLVRATREIPVRARRDAKEKPIGEIEVGAEVYVLETIAGWTNVLPKDLGVMPPDGEGFWIPVTELPAAPKPSAP